MTTRTPSCKASSSRFGQRRHLFGLGTRTYIHTCMHTCNPPPPPSVLVSHARRQGSRLVLRALALRLMGLLASTEFRQSSITDRLIYGRKLRAWQVRAAPSPFRRPVSSPTVMPRSLVRRVISCSLSCSAAALSGFRSSAQTRQLTTRVGTSIVGSGACWSSDDMT